MLSLIQLIFREKVKALLIISAFSFILFALMFMLSKYYQLKSDMDDVINKEENRKITFITDNDSILIELKKMKHISITNVNEFSEEIIVSLLVDSEVYMDRVVAELENFNLKLIIGDESTKEELNTLKKLEIVFNLFIICIVVLFVVVLHVIKKLLIEWDKYNIYLLYAFGYKNIYIIFIILFKLFLLMFISFIMSTVLFFIVNIIFIQEIVRFQVVLYPFILFMILLLIEIFPLHRSLKKIDVGYLIDEE